MNYFLCESATTRSTSNLSASDSDTFCKMLFAIVRFICNAGTAATLLDYYSNFLLASEASLTSIFLISFSLIYLCASNSYFDFLIKSYRLSSFILTYFIFLKIWFLALVISLDIMPQLW